MKKTLQTALVLVLFLGLFLNATDVQAKAKQDNNNITHGKVTPKSIGAGALSLLIWPGIGQDLNGAPSKKVVTHAVIGLLQVTRIWSCYDAVVDRKGGYWEGRI